MKKSTNAIFLIILLLLHIFLNRNLKFTPWPEMLTYSWLMDSGYRLYTDIIMPYFPVLPTLLMFIYRLFGFSVLNLKIITLINIIIIDLEIYWLTQKIYRKNIYGFIAVSGYIISQLFFDGNGLWFEMASVPLILLLFYLINNLKYKNLYLAGLVFGLLILLKQNNIIFIIPVFLKLYNRKIDFFRFCFFSLLPILIITSYYLLTPDFNNFFYWSLYHPLFIHSRLPGFMLMPSLRQILIVLFWFSPALFLKNNKYHLVWLICSFIFAFPRFSYFHLQVTITFFWLLFPSVIKDANKFIKAYLLIYLILILFLFGKFVARDWNKPDRFFTEDVASVKSLVELKIPVNEKVFYFNTSSEYFVLGSIFPGKPWADNFPWYMEVPGMQEKIISGLKNVKYVIYNPFQSSPSYDLGSYRPKQILDYINANFSYKENLNSSMQLLIRKI